MPQAAARRLPRLPQGGTSPAADPRAGAVTASFCEDVPVRASRLVSRGWPQTLPPQRRRYCATGAGRRGRQRAYPIPCDTRQNGLSAHSMPAARRTGKSACRLPSSAACRPCPDSHPRLGSHPRARRHPITIRSPTAQPAAAHPEKPGRSTRGWRRFTGQSESGRRSTELAIARVTCAFRNCADLALSWPQWCNQGEAPGVLGRCGCRGW